MGPSSTVHVENFVGGTIENCYIRGLGGFGVFAKHNIFTLNVRGCLLHGDFRINPRSVGIYSNSCTLISGCDISAWGEGVRASGTQVSIMGCRIEVNRIGLNLGMLEMIGLPFAFNERGYAGITNFVSVVEDIDAETNFYREVFGLALIGEHRLRGEQMEKLIGLPAGAVVAMNILGAKENPYGQMQLVAYQGASGANRYPSARPPACGQLHPVWLTEQLGALGCDTSNRQTIHTLLGTAEAIRLQTPGGMMSDIFRLKQKADCES